MLQGRLEQLEEAEKPELRKNYAIKLTGDSHPTKRIFHSDNLSKKYGSNVLAYPDITIQGNERLLIKGSNGSGKTTLLKIAANILEPDTGEATLGQDIKLGYFSQNINGLDYSQSSYDNLETTGASATDIHREAKSLGLTTNDLRKKPSELSRGQQAKLSFAKLLLSRNHLLILDEPTNHLDLPTREKIETALQDYQGAMLVASHDKYFCNQIGIQRTINLDKEAYEKR